jgi:hypothetical protein
MKLSLRGAVPRTILLILAAMLYFCAARLSIAQVSPDEILNPTLRALEESNFTQLKSVNQAIARQHFPFPFYLSRFVGLDPTQQPQADSRGLEFVQFRDRVVLKATGNYNAAYDSKQFTRNERASRTFRDVFLPILQLLTQTIPPDVNCDSIGFEVSYHVREKEKSYDYEGREILVVVFDRQDAFQIVQVTNDIERQDILNRSMIFLNGQDYGLSLLERDPMIVDTAARSKTLKPDAGSTVGASTSASHLLHSSPNLPNSAPATQANLDISLVKPAATAADADRLQTEHKSQLDALAKDGEARFQFVNYDPPAFIVVSKQMALQMTLKNTQRFDPEKTSIYKRAAQALDLFLAPKMKDLLAKAPDEASLDFYVFSIVNPLMSTGKERSEAVDFVIPKPVAEQFANAEITSQQLVDKSQVLVNGVRIGLNLQLVE